jgi:hypothetical protein
MGRFRVSRDVDGDEEAQKRDFAWLGRDVVGRKCGGILFICSWF